MLPNRRLVMRLFASPSSPMWSKTRRPTTRRILSGGGSSGISSWKRVVQAYITLTSRVRRCPSFFSIILLMPLAAENYMLSDPEWNMDIMPEIVDGKNIADFIDPDILEKLDALEREEEKLQADGFYDSDDMVSLLPFSLLRFWLIIIIGRLGG